MPSHRPGRMNGTITSAIGDRLAQLKTVCNWIQSNLEMRKEEGEKSEKKEKENKEKKNGGEEEKSL